MKQYIIIKASRIPPNGYARVADAYSGPTWRDVFGEKPRIYNTLEEARKDAVKLTLTNPVGFKVWEVGGSKSIDDAE